MTAAAAAQRAWADTPAPLRGSTLFRFAQLLDDSKERLGRIITLEQGKALGEAIGEVARAAAEARFMAGEASRPIGPHLPERTPGVSCQTVTEPLGVVAAICPWNFPVVTPVRKIAPALAWGNTVVFKPASLTPWSAVFLATLLEQRRRCRLASSTSSPARAPRSARRSFATRALPASASPARRRSGTHIYEQGGPPARSRAAGAGRQESRRRRRLRRSRERRAGNRGGGVPLQRSALHRHQPGDRARGCRPMRSSTASSPTSAASGRATASNPARRWGRS